MGLFKESLKFPFKPFKRMWWFWIAAIPVLGWIMFGGYLADINRHLVRGKHGLPAFGEFWPTAKTGLLYTFIALVIAFVAYYIPNIPYYIGWVLWFYILLISPVLLVHFSVTRQLADGFNIKLASKLVFGNFVKYLAYMVRIICITLIWALASLPIITIPVTLPALYLGTVYLLAMFYKETSNICH